MNIHRIRLEIALTAIASLIVLYLMFLTHFLSILGQPLGLVEAVIFYTMSIRAGVLFFVPHARRIYGPVKVILYSIEILISVICSLAFSLTGERGYFIVISSILPAWIASSFFVLLPYSIFEYGISLHKGGKLLPILSSGVVLLADSLLAVDFAAITHSIPRSLDQLGVQIVGFVAKLPAIVIIQSSSSLVVSGAGVLFYVSLLAYVSVSQVEVTRYQGKYTFALLIMLSGNLILAGWTLLFLANQTTNMLWILTVPGIALPIFLLVGFHGR